MIKILDHGFVELLNIMGDEKSIVSCARVSYNNDKFDSELIEKDIRLLKFLWNHEHFSPFEMVEFQFMINLPIFVARQWMRHRSFSYNEVSGRYTELEVNFYIPDNFRSNDTNNKQSSSILKDSLLKEEMQENISKSSKASINSYHSLLKSGVAREIARIVLPVNIYTRFVLKGNLRSFLHFIKLRDHKDAQFEIKEYAAAIKKIILEKLPALNFIK